MSKDTPISEPNLTTISLHPEIQGTPIHFLNEWITPEEFFFLRNHYPYPPITPISFIVEFVGSLKKQSYFHFNELLQMPSKTIVLPLECSGNRRNEFEPPTFGTQWNDGAISQGMWRGVPLQYLLSMVGVEETAYDVVFEGQDSGKIAGLEGDHTFARSLPIKKAMHPDIIIAYELNGKPIPYKHGYPLRLIVPEWYAMASVKWLKRVIVIDQPFEGPYQKLDYHYFPYEDSNVNGVPVTIMKVNSIIQQPLPQSTKDAGRHQIFGIAWTGAGTIEKVEISFDNGINWEKTEVTENPDETYSWVFWSYVWNAYIKGKYTIMVRATDSNGRTQPFEVEWNRLGYGYNGVSTINCEIV